jgi:hypothetical protein
LLKVWRGFENLRDFSCLCFADLPYLLMAGFLHIAENIATQSSCDSQQSGSPVGYHVKIHGRTVGFSALLSATYPKNHSSRP